MKSSRILMGGSKTIKTELWRDEEIFTNWIEVLILV